MRVLVVHRYFWPENVTVFPLMLRDVVELHLERGDEVTVVTGSSDDFEAQRERAFRGQLDIVSFAAPIDRGISIPGRLINMLRLMAASIRVLLFSGHWDLLYTVSYPPFFAGFLVFAGRVFGRVRHVVYYVQDIFTYRIRRRLFQDLFRWWNGLTVRYSSRVVTLSDSMKNELLSSIDPERRRAVASSIVIIPNFSVDLDGEPIGPVRPVRDIIYAGNHGISQNLDHFLEILAHKSVYPKPKVSFFGDGTEKAALRRRSAELGLEDSVEFCPTIDREAARREIAQSRFGLVGAQPDLMRYAFPSKLTSYSAVGTRAIVMSPDEGAFATWLTESNLGYTLDPLSPERGALQLASILAAPDRPEVRAQVQEEARLQLSRDRYLGRMRSLIESLDD